MEEHFNHDLSGDISIFLKIASKKKNGYDGNTEKSWILRGNIIQCVSDRVLEREDVLSWSCSYSVPLLEKTGLGNQTAWVQISVPPNNCGTLGKLLSLCVPHFPHWWNVGKSHTHLDRADVGIQRMYVTG